MSSIELFLVYEPERQAPAARAATAELQRWLGEEAEVVGAAWPLTIRGRDREVRLEPVEAPELHDVQLARSLLDEEQRAELEQARRALRLGIDVADDEVPMSALLEGLALARPLLGGFLAVFDPDGSTVHPGRWVQAVADTPVPPRPDSLYAIHAVVDEDDIVWMHTHGLSRFGVPELELLEVPRDLASLMGHVLNAVAARVLLEGSPDPGEVVAWGSGLEAALLPWDEVSHLARAMGTDEDRDASHHRRDNRVLCLPGDDGGWRNAAEGAAALGDHPVLYRSTWETERMEALARLRWDLFVQLRDVLGADERFRFCAKLGYQGPAGFREHLWFDVHGAGRDGLEGTLLNEPHQDLGMHAGDRAEHDVARLSDLAIHSPMGSFNPETLPHLAAWLNHQLQRQGQQS